ncbi:MAG: 2-dehydro-3-deoxygluconokinase [Acidobacteriota bacterium]|nr:2-dehydro-3-deoxygluconokinase [Acidobacteriota bacterium]
MADFSPAGLINNQRLLFPGQCVLSQLINKMTESLNVKPKEHCRWDCVSLGEVMLRFDPGQGRIHTTRTFDVWEGGGEYNVARGLKRCFGMETAIATALADNPVGRLVQDLIYQGGVDQSHIKWARYDGVGRVVRNGLNFTERGFGVRAALGCSDRGHTAISQLRPGDIDWEKIFGQEGARWFHTGGIFCALSETTPLVAREAMEMARHYGTIISYDLNYRESLWKSIGGRERAQDVNRDLASFVDVMIGNEEDFTACLGFEVEGLDEHHSKLDVENFRRMIERAVSQFPNFKVVATTLRNAKTASINDWGAVCYADGELYESATRQNLEIFDRVGGGDSFASGLIYGLLTNRGPQWAVECGAAHGALAMTTPGDTTMMTLAEVERVMKGGAARVER